MPPTSRCNILGVHINAINMSQALATIDGWLASRDAHYVCVTSAHGILECRKDPVLRKMFNQSGLMTPDGMSLVWLLKLRGFRNVERVCGSDLMLEIIRLSEARRWRHFFYGGTPGVADALAHRLLSQFPGLQIAGTYCPPFRPLTESENLEIIDRIRSSQADIVWVGISTPKQEQWMAEHVGKVNAPVLIGVGAAFDFVSGRKKRAPRWVQHIGMEWLFRLGTEPRRLWKRYAQYPLFLALVIAQSLGITRYD